MSLQEEADLYRDMNHDAINQQFVDDLMQAGQVGPRVIDLGCGPAAIPIRLAQCLPNIELMAIDSATEMLEIAHLEIEIAGVIHQVVLQQDDASNLQGYEDGMADTVISNSFLHHLDQPENGLSEAQRLTKPGGRLFLRDLFRPDCAEEVERLVQQHAEEESNEAKQLLRQSLHAALSLDEITKMVQDLGMPRECVRMTSNRHWTIDWMRPTSQV